MRYIILSRDDEGNIGKILKKLEKEKKIDILERGEPLAEIKAKIQKLALALNNLEKSFIDVDILETYISKKSGLGLSVIRNIREKEEEFYRKVGLIK